MVKMGKNRKMGKMQKTRFWHSLPKKHKKAYFGIFIKNGIFSKMAFWGYFGRG